MVTTFCSWYTWSEVSKCLRFDSEVEMMFDTIEVYISILEDINIFKAMRLEEYMSTELGLEWFDISNYDSYLLSEFAKYMGRYA